MCLSRQRFIPVPDVGYKVVGCLWFPEGGSLCTPLMKKRLLENEWTEDDAIGELFDEEKKPYRLGFHVFVRKSDAKNWCVEGQRIVEVEIDKNSVTATGLETICLVNGATSVPVIVCRRIRVRTWADVQRGNYNVSEKT